MKTSWLKWSVYKDISKNSGQLRKLLTIKQLTSPGQGQFCQKQLTDSQTDCIPLQTQGDSDGQYMANAKHPNYQPCHM